MKLSGIIVLMLTMFIALTAFCAVPAEARGHKTDQRGEREPTAAAQETLRRLLDDDRGSHRSRTLKVHRWMTETLPVLEGRKAGNIFEPADLHRISKLGIGLPKEEMFDTVQQALIEKYPGKITPTRRWTVNYAGSALGQLTILYASTKEYLVFFGSPIGNVGHSGRYDMDCYDMMMNGEMWTFIEGETEKNVFLPGDMARLRVGQLKGYRIIDEGWMLEYGRGDIISVFDFGVIAPAKYITRDWEGAFMQIGDFARAAIRALLNLNP